MRPRPRRCPGPAARRSARRRSSALTAAAPAVMPAIRRWPAGERSRHPDRPDRDLVAATGFDRLAEEVDVAPARSDERAVERLDPVDPDADSDGFLLGGDVGAELRAATLGEQLDAERGPRRHLR